MFMILPEWNLMKKNMYLKPHCELFLIFRIMPWKFWSINKSYIQSMNKGSFIHYLLMKYSYKTDARGWRKWDREGEKAAAFQEMYCIHLPVLRALWLLVLHTPCRQPPATDRAIVNEMPLLVLRQRCSYKELETENIVWCYRVPHLYIT